MTLVWNTGYLVTTDDLRLAFLRSFVRNLTWILPDFFLFGTPRGRQKINKKQMYRQIYMRACVKKISTVNKIIKTDCCNVFKGMFIFFFLSFNFFFNIKQIYKKMLIMRRTTFNKVIVLKNSCFSPNNLCF